MGHSLGGSYAVRLAQNSFLRGAVSLAGFTSHQAIGAHALRNGGCPAGLNQLLAWILLPHRFEPLADDQKETAPILIVHGDLDGTVPYWMGEEFHQALEESAFLPMPGYGHERFHEGPLGPSYLAALDRFFTDNSGTPATR